MNPLVFQSPPPLQIGEPADPDALPPGNNHVMLGVLSAAGGVGAFVLLAILGHAAIGGVSGAVAVVASIPLFITGGGRMVARSRAKNLRSLASLGIRATYDIPKGEKARAFAPLNHLKKTLRYAERGLTAFAEAIVPTTRGEVEVRLYHHTYTVSSGNHTQTVRHWVATAPAPDHWPELRLSNEHFIAKLVKTFGGKDLELDDADFNERWIVQCDNEDFAIVALPPAVQDLLADAPRHETWVIGHGLVTCLHVGVHKDQDIRQLADRVATVRAMIPSELDQPPSA